MQRGWGLWKMQILGWPSVSAQAGSLEICIAGAQSVWLLLVFLIFHPCFRVGSSLNTASQEPQD